STALRSAFPERPFRPAARGSFTIRVGHAAAAIESGLCKTVLITHGESGCSGVWRTRNVVAPTSLAGQFEQPPTLPSPASGGGKGGGGTADFVHDPGLALHEDLWALARATGDG